MLATRSGDAFHLGETWTGNWSDAFGPVHRHYGALPCVVVRDRIGPLTLPVVHSATNPHTMRFDIDPDARLPDDLARQLLQAHGAAAIRFDYLPEDARLLAAQPQWTAGYRTRIEPHARAPVVDTRGSHTAWITARSKRFRQRTRQATRALIEQRGMRVEFRCNDGDEQLYGQMLAVERSGWKGRAGTAIADDPATHRFYARLMRDAAAAGALRCALLWDGDALVAFEMGVLSRRRLFIPKVGYDEALADLSPGYVLAAEHIRKCFEAPDVDWYDKMGNGMTPAPYKMRFTDRCDTLYRLTVYAPGARGGMLLMRDRARAQAKEWRDAWRARGAGGSE